MPESYDLLSRFGKDISSAITAPSQARVLRGRLDREEEDFRRRNLRDDAARIEQERLSVDREKARGKMAKQEDARERVADLIRKGQINTREGKAALFEAGENLRSIYPKAPKPRAPKDYEVAANSAFGLANTLNKQMGDLFSSLSEKDSLTPEDVEIVNAQYEGTKALLEEVKAVDTKMMAADFARFSMVKDSILKGFNQQKLQLLETSIIQSMASYGANMKEVGDRVENYKSSLASYADLSGVPSTADINKYVQAARASGKVPMDMIWVAISNAENEAELEEIIDSEEAPDELKDLAYALIKNQRTAAFVVSPEKMKKEKFEAEEPLRGRIPLRGGL